MVDVELNQDFLDRMCEVIPPNDELMVRIERATKDVEDLLGQKQTMPSGEYREMLGGHTQLLLSLLKELVERVKETD